MFYDHQYAQHHMATEMRPTNRRQLGRRKAQRYETERLYALYVACTLERQRNATAQQHLEYLEECDEGCGGSLEEYLQLPRYHTPRGFDFLLRHPELRDEFFSKISDQSADDEIDCADRPSAELEIHGEDERDSCVDEFEIVAAASQLADSDFVLIDQSGCEVRQRLVQSEDGESSSSSSSPPSPEQQRKIVMQLLGRQLYRNLFKRDRAVRGGRKPPPRCLVDAMETEMRSHFTRHTAPLRKHDPNRMRVCGDALHRLIAHAMARYLGLNSESLASTSDTAPIAEQSHPTHAQAHTHMHTHTHSPPLTANRSKSSRKRGATASGEVVIWNSKATFSPPTFNLANALQISV